MRYAHINEQGEFVSEIGTKRIDGFYGDDEGVTFENLNLIPIERLEACGIFWLGEINKPDEYSNVGTITYPFYVSVVTKDYNSVDKPINEAKAIHQAKVNAKAKARAIARLEEVFPDIVATVNAENGAVNAIQNVSELRGRIIPDMP